MLSDEDSKRIKQAADRAMGSRLDHLKKPYDSTDISALIASAIAKAIEEYDSLKNP